MSAHGASLRAYPSIWGLSVYLGQAGIDILVNLSYLGVIRIMYDAPHWSQASFNATMSFLMWRHE